MSKITNWISNNRSLSLGLGIGVAVAGAFVLLFVLFYEPPLEMGKIIDIQTTSDKVLYDQHDEAKYRYVTKYRWVTKRGSDGKEHREQESYQDRVFDHREYYIERHFDGADYFVVIEAPSQKRRDKTLSAKIFLTKDRYESIRNMKGSTFVFAKALGDSRHDFNNTTQEMDRQWYNSFDLIQWMRAHNVNNTP